MLIKSLAPWRMSNKLSNDLDVQWMFLNRNSAPHWGDPQNSGPCLLLRAKECLTQCGKEAQGIMWKVPDFLFLSLWVYTSGISENYNYPELTLTIQISLNSPNNWWNITFFLSPSPPECKISHKKKICWMNQCILPCWWDQFIGLLSVF